MNVLTPAAAPAASAVSAPAATPGLMPEQLWRLRFANALAVVRDLLRPAEKLLVISPARPLEAPYDDPEPELLAATTRRLIGVSREAAGVEDAWWVSYREVEKVAAARDRGRLQLWLRAGGSERAFAESPGGSLGALESVVAERCAGLRLHRAI